MEIGEAQRWSDFVRHAPTGAMRWVAHRVMTAGRDVCGDAPLPTSPPNMSAGTPPEIIVAIGPEGGFTEEEVAIAIESGWRQLDLGPRILRVETAAVAVAAWAIFGDEGSKA
jgi:16S rRNA (uracil1498-N3)-methyltransferase